MIALYHAIKGYNYKHPFPAFAKTCVVRKMCTAVRLSNKQKNTILSNAFYLGEPIYEDNVETYLDRVPAKNIDPCDLIAYKDERNEMLNNVQKNLSCLERQALKLYCDVLQYQEIANILGVKEKSVDNALQRAKRKLRSTQSDRNNC